MPPENRDVPPGLWVFSTPYPLPRLRRRISGSKAILLFHQLLGNRVLTHSLKASSTCSDRDYLALDPAGHSAAALAHHHVHFAAHAELGQIDAGLDGEAGVGQDLAIVLGLQIIKVRAVAVNVAGDGVPGAMDKVLPPAFRLNEVAHRLVHFPAVNLALGLECLLHGANAGVACAAYNLEDLSLLVAGYADRPRPGNVVVDRVGLFAFRPNVEQHEIALLDRRGCC